MNRTAYESMMSVIDTSLTNQGYDIEVLMQRLVSATTLEKIAGRVPKVEIDEAWHRASVTLARRDDTTNAATANETSRFAFTGFPDNTQLFKLPIIKGRTARGCP